MTRWGRVLTRAERVLIVAAGPSLRGFDLAAVNELRGVHVIAVNHAINHIRADSWFTLDPRERIRELMRKRKPVTRYYAAVPEGYGWPDAAIYWHRAPREPGVTFLHRLTGDGPLKSRPCLSDDPTAIHTGNSAWGALGLAWHMGADRIAILGLDGTQEPYGLGDGAPAGSFRHLPALFESAIPQLRERGVMIMNGSPDSAVHCFPLCTPARAVEWIAT